MRLTRVLLGIASAVLLTEVAFRIVEATPLWQVLPVPEAALYGPDADTGYRHRAGAQGIWVTEHRTQVRISALGLRDRERPLERSAAPRAVVVGNSLIEALQVAQPQTAVAVAEHNLQRDWPGAEVVNLGLAGATAAVDVARLRSVVVSLHPDIAVVVVASDELSSKAAVLNEGFPGYRQAPDGGIELSYGFRDSAGYRFRMSAAGQALYWLVDHFAVIRLLNNRKNVGLFAEWPGTAAAAGPPPDRKAGGCNPAEIDNALALWRDDRPAADAAIRDAFLRDLGEIGRTNRMTVVLALRGIGGICGDSAIRRSAVATIRGKVEAAGLVFVDFDGAVGEKTGGAMADPLFGFGADRGMGHLNVFGNRIWGEALATLIADVIHRRTVFRFTG